MTDTKYFLQPIPFTQVNIQDNLWLPRIEVNRTITIPYEFKKCEETGRIDNFDRAAGKMSGKFEGIFPFNDSDVFKIIEGAAYSLQVQPDPELEAYIDELVDKIADAQEEDGYLYTARSITPDDPHEWAGPERWSNLYMSHELYNLGHMYESAVAYYQSTGKRKFLDVCLKSADLIVNVFREDALRNVPGHQEVELGLVKLYNVTGNKKYLNLSKFFLDERGHANNRYLQSAADNIGYMQDHLPIIDQDEAVGHAVRAMYMYSAMTDVAVLTADKAYINALHHLWNNIVQKKLALTGGIGARRHGEAFDDNYVLPNATSYNETCAAIGNIFWNYRMFLLDGNSKYYDVLERTLYNGFLAGTSMQGTEFFYVNPLEFDGEFAFNSDETTSRQPWFNCSCCPTNVVRMMPSLPGYIYAIRDNQLYVNLYISSKANININGSAVSITQQTDYPWDGTIKIIVNPIRSIQVTLSLRVPGWASGKPVPSDLYSYINDSQGVISVTVNGDPITVKIEDGYIHINRIWQAHDIVKFNLPMPIRRVTANNKVKDCKNKVAIERGPIVYCAEGIDNNGQALNILLPDKLELSTQYCDDLLNGVVVISGDNFFAIPYYAWGHRGVSSMAVWFSTQ